MGTTSEHGLLRAIVTNFAANHIHELQKCDRFKALLTEGGDFAAAALFSRVAERYPA